MTAAPARIRREAVRAVLPALGAGVLGLLVAALAQDPTARAALFRYGLLASGVLAVAPPLVLLPDREGPLQRLVNPTPGALLRRQLGRWLPTVAALLLPPVLIVIQRGEGHAALAEVWLLLVGVGLFAFAHYATLGPASQGWQEGSRGGWYHRAVAERPEAGFQIPPGLVPSTLAAPLIFLAAVTAALGGALLGAAAPGWGWLAPAVLLGTAGFRLARSAPAFDRLLYQTDALYAETLRSAGGREAGREPVRPEAVYWAPPSLRPHVWASLVQLDRRLPLGRLFALGVLGLWALLLQGAPLTVASAYLALLLLLKNAAVGLLAAEALAPRPFGLWVQSPLGWTLTRALVNLRWTLPLVLALALVALFHPTFGWTEVAWWTGADLALALLAAAATTAAAEHRHRRRFA